MDTNRITGQVQGEELVGFGRKGREATYTWRA
jgi:hypothetical protein